MPTPDTDPVLRALYPDAESPEWAHAYDAAWREAESRAKTLGFLYPQGAFYATLATEPHGARFSVMGADGPALTVIEVVRDLLFDDYFDA